MEKFVIPKHTVIQYVRSNKKIPYGVVVAIKSDNGFRIGYSLCNKKDRFNKRMALKIALGRASEALGSAFANTITIGGHGVIPHSIDRMLDKFESRCKKYYKV